MSTIPTLPIRAGKFLLTPLSRIDASGLFSATLSIRRGHGSQTHDRVYTFTPTFTSRASALMYAAAQGRIWLVNPASLA